MQFLRITLLLISFISLFQPGSLIGQNTSQKKPNTPPKLGLVLSGGGAKGIAHIGVLKAMEKEGLRPDYITGTSMGSIIGGLYALGYSADQLDTIIRTINWDLVLSNNIPLDYIAYEEKEYYNRYLLELPIEKWKLKLPSGVIQGQMLGEMLARYCWPAKNYSSFDEFPIPFRCIATDVSTGKEIVFSDGSLAMALRASMAIPTAFTPVDLDTTIAVDGGVVNNFPVDEVFKMGADIVIGVNVGDGLIPAEELGGMTDILFQVSMIPSLTKLKSQIDQCEIYIKPDLKKYGTASFSNYNEILQLGDSAGIQFQKQLSHLADSAGIRSKSILNPPPLNPDSIYIGEIEIIGNKLISSRLMLTKLHIEEGDKVSREEIEKGVRGIFGINSFKKVVYRLSPLTPKNTYKLTIKAIEKTPAILKGSVHYDNIFKIGVVMNLTLRNLVGKSSRLIFATDISENPKVRFDYLKYIGLRQRFAINVRYNYFNESIPSYQEGLLTDIDVSKENNFSLGFITTQSLRNSLFIGATYQLNTQKQKFSSIIPQGVKHGDFNSIIGDLLFTANTLNDRNYPTQGREITLGIRSYFLNDYKIVYDKGVDTIYYPIEIDDITLDIPITEDEFNKLIINPLTPNYYGMAQFGFTRFYKLSDNFQVVPEVSVGVTLSVDSTGLFEGYKIGGHQRVRQSDIRFFGLNYAEYNYENFADIGLFFQNIILKNIYLKYGANFLLPYEYVPLDNLDEFSFNTMIDKNSVLGYGAELTYKSFLGPISLGASRNTRDSYFRYYFAVGFSFNYSD